MKSIHYSPHTSSPTLPAYIHNPRNINLLLNNFLMIIYVNSYFHVRISKQSTIYPWIYRTIKWISRNISAMAAIYTLEPWGRVGPKFLGGGAKMKIFRKNRNISDRHFSAVFPTYSLKVSSLWALKFPTNSHIFRKLGQNFRREGQSMIEWRKGDWRAPELGYLLSRFGTSKTSGDF